MPETHKRAYRHPQYTPAYHVKNWHQYDQALRHRGDITLWISQDAIDAWTAPKTGKRGAQPGYSDLAIETALALRLLFHLPLRQTETTLRPQRDSDCTSTPFFVQEQFMDAEKTLERRENIHALRVCSAHSRYAKMCLSTPARRYPASTRRCSAMGLTVRG
jgi:hypothetical protein